MKDDTISRQAAITAIQKAYADTEGGMDKLAVWKNVGLTNALHIMQDLPSAQPEQQWIPCDKGEPDEDMECWVTGKTTDVLYRGIFTKRYGERRDKGFITSGGFMWWNTALAWMPIYEPEPYRPEGDEKHGTPRSV